MSNKIASFRKFSELKVGKENEMSLEQEQEQVLLPNLNKKSSKISKPLNTKSIKTSDEVDLSKEDNKTLDTKDYNFDINEEKTEIELIGKIAKLPKNTKASKGFSFMESIKISKSSIWYLLIEKQSNELQMIKYNLTKGVNLNKFVNELKNYYCNKYSSNKSILEKINLITVEGNDKFSIIKNISNIDLDGKKLITILTEDLIKLLSN